MPRYAYYVDYVCHNDHNKFRICMVKYIINVPCITTSSDHAWLNVMILQTMSEHKF